MRLPLGLATLALLTVPAAAAQPPRPYRAGIDVTNYEFSLDVPAYGSVIEGRAVLSVRRTAPTDTLVLDLLALRVDSVLVNGRPVIFGRDSATLRVPLPRTGDAFTIAVRYGGSVSDGLIFSIDPQGRWMAFGDNWPARARHWLPTVDHPSDKATVTWIVRASSERRVVANGLLEEESPIAHRDGGLATSARTLTRWRESRPIPPYLMVIAVAPLAYYDLGPSACGRSEFDGCVRQSVYVAPEVRDFLPGPFAQAGSIVDFFTSLVAPFPFEKLAHLQSSTRFGGMENASAIFYSDRGFRQRTMGTGVVAHETAHQWFGDAVTPAEWGHVWLSEGFASYFEQLWVERSQGDSAFLGGMRELREEIIQSKVTPLRPVIDTAQTDLMALLNTNSYQKGAWTLHMLRRMMGDSAFFTGVRSYYMKYRHRNALTDDLRAELEAASGQELGWFFEQWLRRPGYVELTTKWRYDRGKRRVSLEVTQGPRFPPYRFPLTVRVTDADGVVRRVSVEVPAVRKARLELPLELPTSPQRLELDPDVSLLATFKM
jgi:aminopeptidase N